MWKLKEPSQTLIDWYKDKMLDGLCDRIRNKKGDDGNILLSPEIQDILIPKLDGVDDTSYLEKLLISKPQELLALCTTLMGKIIPGYNDAEFEDFLKVKNKTNRTQGETALYNKYNDTLRNLLKVFDYETQISENKSRAYKLTMEQGRNTCTYCNRQYVITVGGKNDASRIVRPELDHWFSKELFPLMSLSLYNLIPSCSICNSSIKGNTIFRLDSHVHPYLDETPSEPQFKFKYKLTKESKWEVVIDKSNDLKEKNMIETFKLEDLYKHHGELEVKDILLFKYQNSDSYLKYLLKNLLVRYKYSEREVYRMMFGTEIESSSLLDRPFSKLKKDILTQLGILENGHFKI